MHRHPLWLSPIAALAIIVGTVVGAPGTAGAATWTFECTGAPEPWTVPDGVTEARFDLFGAKGGDVGTALGGAGGGTSATIALTPGETLTIRVGCPGGDGTDATDDDSGGAGGFGGGADGGDKAHGIDFGASGAGGGGASDVRRGGDLVIHRILIAAGGGGAGYGLAGGDGGGVNGEDGSDAAWLDNPSAAKGGDGAIGATGGSAGFPDGTAGTVGAGGVGATNPGVSLGGAGGGGGGGLAGGGGGGYDGLGWGGGGGGGGSGFGPEGAELFTGVWNDSGRVDIIATLPVSFSDVPDDNPFHDDILWLAGAGITGGFIDGTFRPTLAVSRQSMAAFLYRLSGSPGGAAPTCSAAAFDDVPADHDFCGEIDWLVDEGITGGYTDGTFRPTAPVSRQSMAAFLYRLAGEPDGPDPTCEAAPFPDVPTTNPFCGTIEWLASTSITGGFGDGTFRPTTPVSRQSMAAFLHRYDALP